MNDPIIDRQARMWSRHAADYEDVFLDPYEPGVTNPLWGALEAIPDSGTKSVVDLGCGTGPLLPYLADRYQRVYALDFAASMLERARARLEGPALKRTTFLQRPMHQIDDLAGRLDVAVAVNSLVIPDVRRLDRTLAAVKSGLKPGGLFLGVVPSIDAISYHLMLLVDQALEQGLDEREAERVSSLRLERKHYDFALGRFRFKGLKQKFWQPFEVEYRLAKAKFKLIALEKVLYPWDETLPGGEGLERFPPSWDWFFMARA